MKPLISWILSVSLFVCSYCQDAGNPEDEAPIINNPQPATPNSNPTDDVSSQPHQVLYYLSNPWIIAVCTVVGIVLLFNISMICYLQCSTGSGTGRPSFLNKNARKGYSNVANIDSEDISNSEMEQIDIN